MSVLKFTLCVSLCLLFNNSHAQTNFKKSIVTNMEQLKLDVLGKDKLIAKVASLKRSNQAPKQLSTNTDYHLASNEQFIHLNGKTTYKMRFKGQGEREVVKSIDNMDVASVDFSMDGDIKVLNEAGNFVYDDLAHGSASAYLFYSPDFNLLNVYKPYQYGFNYTNIGFSKDIVCIYSQEKSNSTKFKLSTLTHEGKVIFEKEFDLEAYLASDVKVIGDRIFLLLTNTGTPKPRSRVMSFDLRLNFYWKRDFDKGIVNYEIKTGSINNLILLNTQDQINCIDALSGSNLWSKPVNELLSGNSSKTINAEYVINNEFVAIVIGSYINKMFINNELNILDTKTGKVLYNESLGGSKKELEIINCLESFIVVNNDELYEYRP